MKKTLLFIHGYGSDRNSRKFQELINCFSEDYNLHCLEWVVYSDIPYLLDLAVKKCENIKNMLIVGDSTGANFAYQVRQMRNRKEDKLVLLSPLLDVSKRKLNIPFPDTFSRHLLKIVNPSNALVVASKTDEVIDQQFLFDEPNKKFTLFEVTDGHRLEKFHEYLPAIKSYINKHDEK